ncbi:MAG TPA: nuclear transport factor 2 family protein [Sphingomicrobium sp.]|nr:nuclear transport factor 2 family protein [Sphingomicrobium sp.]
MRMIALSAMVLGLGHAASAQQQDNGLIAFADSFDQAQLTKNGAALEQMISDDLVFITGSGKRQGKSAFIAGWTDPQDSYDPIVLVDRIVTPLGPDAGMVSAETVLSGTSGRKKFSSRFRYTDTFKRVGGEWRAVHIQVTRIPD